MSDASVPSTLRASVRLVVIEAPAGCGKTYQGAEYAKDVASHVGAGRVLVLTHTHAACDVFARRTQGCAGRVEIRTIDSLIGQVSAAYHKSLGLPVDTGAWARDRSNGYDLLAANVAALLRSAPMIAKAIATRYPVIIFDEHQDASADQNAIALACHQAGATVRVFGDLMQRIFGSRKKSEIAADRNRWANLKQLGLVDALDRPYRWDKGTVALGGWILGARKALENGGKISLRPPLPMGLSVIVAENDSPVPGGFRLQADQAKVLRAFVRGSSSLLVLAARNKTVDSLRAFFGRTMPIWEGHVREALSQLLCSLREKRGYPIPVAEALVAFLGQVATGFSPTAYGNVFIREVRTGCTGKSGGKPAAIRALGRFIVDEPNHRGVSKMLRSLHIRTSDATFSDVKIDYYREFWDAVHIGEFEDADEGFAEISRRRSYSRPQLPRKTISTIHKAKGLEFDQVLIVPCDKAHFGDTDGSRCKLYVAMSRATTSLTFVVSQKKPSPLIEC